MDFDWKKTVSAVAPMLGTAIGGPFGAAAGLAISAALGVDNTDKAIGGAVAALSPGDLSILRKAELDFQAQMAELGYKSVADLETIAAGDRANARSREIVTSDYTPRVIAGIFIVGWFAIQWFLLSHVIEPSMREIVMRTLGTLDMGLGLILGYYFGSSAGSATKNRTIDALTVR